MALFQLNFKNEEKVVSITLDDEQGIFQLADLFKKLLDDAGIKNTLIETHTDPVEAVEATEEQA
jgi:sugar phosphate isomerase/epimerase